MNLVGFVSEPQKAGTEYQGPWVRAGSQKELARSYEGWEPEVRQLIEVCSFFPLLSRPNKEIWKFSTSKTLPSGRSIIFNLYHFTPKAGSS